MTFSQQTGCPTVNAKLSPKITFALLRSASEIQEHDTAGKTLQELAKSKNEFQMAVNPAFALQKQKDKVEELKNLVDQTRAKREIS